MGCCPSGHNCPEGLTCMLVYAIFSAVLGMFQFGYNTGVINAPQKILENFIADVYKSRTNKFMTEEMLALVWSVAVSIFAVGGMVGGISGGAIADYCGRKCGLLLNNAIAILGATLMSSSYLFRSIECLVMGRFFIGLSCGLNTALVPMYLSEIAPMTLRGALGTVSQLGVTIGLLLSQILGLPAILGTDDGWPFLLGVAFIPAVLQLALLPMCPESPRYLLISKGKVTEATFALQRLRCTSNVDDDIEEMRIEDAAQKQEANVGMWELLTNRSLQTPLIIGVVMQLSQQLSGINAIFYYSTSIFTSAGLSQEMAKLSTIGVGVVMVVMTLISITLMDKTGRRTLHLYGLGGMFLTSMFLTIFLLFGFLYTWMSYMSVISTLIYVVFFAIGPGSIPWMITAELFSQGPRPAAMSIAVMVNWLTNFAVGLGFPLITTFHDNAMEKYAFLPFTVFLAIFWIFTYFKVPETKNRTFEEIAALFRKDDDLIPIEDVQQQSTHSHNSSTGDIYSPKSSTGDAIAMSYDDDVDTKFHYHHQHLHGRPLGSLSSSGQPSPPFEPGLVQLGGDQQQQQQQQQPMNILYHPPGHTLVLDAHHHHHPQSILLQSNQLPVNHFQAQPVSAQPSPPSTFVGAPTLTNNVNNNNNNNNTAAHHHPHHPYTQYHTGGTLGRVKKVTVNNHNNSAAYNTPNHHPNSMMIEDQL